MSHVSFERLSGSFKVDLFQKMFNFGFKSQEKNGNRRANYKENYDSFYVVKFYRFWTTIGYKLFSWFIQTLKSVLVHGYDMSRIVSTEFGAQSKIEKC